jgi:hypothetical protein
MLKIMYDFIRIYYIYVFRVVVLNVALFFFLLFTIFFYRLSIFKHNQKSEPKKIYRVVQHLPFLRLRGF